MKKIISALLALAVGVAIIAPTSNAEAQALGNHCCTSCFCATPAGPVYGLTC